ncbi:hypothetical protein FPV67DRAFT_1684237, partial [Lyophyllum atratum]
PPLVTVHSPGSVRSPPRSPRLSGLLLALKDVIGEDPEDEYDPLTGTTYVEEEPLSAYDTSETITVFNNHSFHAGIEEMQSTVGSSGSVQTAVHQPLTNDDDETLRLPSRLDDPEAQPSIYTTESSPDANSSAANPQLPSDLLSPTELSHLHLGSFIQGSTEAVVHDSDSIDSGYADTWRPPFPTSKSPPRNPLKSTFGVLSSPCGTAFSRVLSPRLSAFISRPPQSPFAPAIVDDDVPSELSLDSPAGDAFAEAEEAEPSEEYIVVEEDIEDAQDPVEDDSEGDAEDDPEEDGHDHDDDDCHTDGGNSSASSWDDQADPTAVYLGMPEVTPEEISIAIQRASRTPSHFLTNGVDLDFGEAVASSSMEIPAQDESLASEPLDPFIPVDDIFGEEDSFDEGDMSLDYTAQLAYLSSPIAINENDTLQYLYDQYSDLSEELEEQSANLPITTAIGPPPENPPPALVEIEPLSATTPMRSGFIRERVFTPPPTLMRGRSGTVITPADSPRSAVSPPVPYSSLSSQGRASPRSQSGRSAWSPDSAVSDLQEPVVSKKVPFGFRNSLAGRARASTFVPNRQSRRDSRAIELPPVKASQSDRASPSPDKITSASPVTGGLRPLRLVLRTSPLSFDMLNLTVMQLLSTRASNIPQHIRNTRFSPDNPIPSPLSSYHLARLANFSPQSAPLSRPSSWYSNPADVNDMTETTYQYDRPFSRASEPPLIHEEDEEDQEETYDHTIRRALPTVPHSAPISQRVSVMRPPSHAIVTPKPTLMFAIASDDVKQVRQVLQSGDAGPNDAVGPQSALAFALTNDQLTNKMEIVKTLLAFGADPKAVVQQTSSLRDSEEVGGTASPPAPSLMDAMDPATRYYVERADAAHTRRTSALIHRSFFRPLTRVRYELIGQDRALEQLFKDLSMHSRQLSVTPIVVLLCGPSGHGKSLLARKFGALLDVPTHTVDMTTIHSAQDLWKSYSMSPYDPPSTRSLAEFLIDNEGKRCVVVLDEIEKTHGESPLWALLMPWEHGRCTFEAHGRLVDVRNVVWLGTSNIGQDLVLEHHSARALPDQLMSREEYTELMGLLRPRVSERLGASMLSRVTTALPFVPFTPEERRAICFEALHTIAGDIIGTLSTDVVDGMVAGALANYTVAEGARSLYRAVSNQLMDIRHLEHRHRAPPVNPS